MPSSTKFEYDRAIILEIIQVSVLFQPLKRRDTLETKGYYGNSLEQRCKVKVRKGEWGES